MWCTYTRYGWVPGHGVIQSPRVRLCELQQQQQEQSIIVVHTQSALLAVTAAAASSRSLRTKKNRVVTKKGVEVQTLSTQHTCMLRRLLAVYICGVQEDYTTTSTRGRSKAAFRFEVTGRCTVVIQCRGDCCSSMLACSNLLLLRYGKRIRTLHSTHQPKITYRAI